MVIEVNGGFEEIAYLINHKEFQPVGKAVLLVDYDFIILLRHHMGDFVRKHILCREGNSFLRTICLCSDDLGLMDFASGLI
jgi:hypothetical protein